MALAKLQQLGCEALLKQSTETQPVLDSLGMLQNLTRSQFEEDKWMQNQQLVLNRYIGGIQDEHLLQYIFPHIWGTEWQSYR